MGNPASAAAAGSSARKRYQVKLASGRVLGPLDLDRIRKLIARDKIRGVELMRELPTGDWRDINLFVEVAELLVARAVGKLEPTVAPASGYHPIGKKKPAPQGESVIVPASPTAPTTVLPTLPTAPVPGEQGQTQHLPTIRLETAALSPDFDPNRTMLLPPDAIAQEPPHEEATVIAPREPEADDDATQVATRIIDKSKDPAKPEAQPEAEPVIELEGMPKALVPTGLGPAPVKIDDLSDPGIKKWVADAHTVMFERPKAAYFPGGLAPRKEAIRHSVKLFAAFVFLALIAYQQLTEKPDLADLPLRLPPVRAVLPTATKKPDPQKSVEAYALGRAFFDEDTAQGYRKAVDAFRSAASFDPDNVQAHAMLATSYLELIDSSNKDENYFSVILRLIETARAKGMDLPETVIADVEFYIAIHKPEAAQDRIVEYSKSHPKYGMEMVYYLALSFYHRGDFQSAASFLGRLPEAPEKSPYPPAVSHLRGLVAEQLGDVEGAIAQYRKAVAAHPKKAHARSKLRLADLAYRTGHLRSTAPELKFLIENPWLLPPQDQARAYFLMAQLMRLSNEKDLALGLIERAVKLDRENHDYLLEMYTLRADSGERADKFRKDARMYALMKEGESQLKEGGPTSTEDALAKFLEARQANPDSYVPLVRIGDMFKNLSDLGNARMNYKRAAEIAKDNIEVWSKYIDVLIQSYEWEDAQAAMDRFRKMDVPQSAIDKAAGDFYARQERHDLAQVHYKKAMARDKIDPDVYLAYAKSLMATRNFKDAPFFFSLARRLDPLNPAATIGIARAVAETDGIDRGIRLLQDELQKTSSLRAELLTAIAEFQIRKGDGELAEQNLKEAMAAKPGYALPWKLQAQIHLSREGQDRNALTKALSAYESYSERNTSDPTGYLERYRIFIRRTEFEKASDELKKIHVLLPRFPNLHYYQGALYSIMGNKTAAIEEFRSEIKNNPNGVPAMIALGKELLERGGAQEALKLFTQAMQLRPQDAEPKHLSAYANYLLKNFSAAIALYSAALQQDPGNPLIYKRLGMAYRDNGDASSAGTAFRKYLEMEPDAPDKAEILRSM